MWCQTAQILRLLCHILSYDYCSLWLSLECYITAKFFLTAMDMMCLREGRKNSKAFVYILEHGKGSNPKALSILKCHKGSDVG